jgi:long-chain acyl-CoA synthetase
LTEPYEKYPNSTAVFFYGTEYTYAEIETLSNKIANSLQQLGIRKGDAIGICLDNCAQYVPALFAILKAGAMVVQLSPLLTPRELLVLIKDSGARGVFTLDYLSPKFEAIKEDSDLEFVIVTSLYDSLPLNPFPCKPFGIPEGCLPMNRDDRVLRYTDILNNKAAFEPVPVDPKKDVAMLQYTSGTTGIPKGAMITHWNLSSYIRLMAIRDVMAEWGKDVYLVTLPMSHNFAITQTVILPLYIGGVSVIMVRFHPEETLKMIHHKRVNVLRGVPSMVSMCCHHPNVRQYDLSSIRHWTIGGAPVPQEVADDFRALTGVRVVEGYGLTETTSGIFGNEWYRDQKSRGFGYVLDQHDLRVIDKDTGKDVPIGQLGELWIKGPTVTIGYWKNPQATAESITDGWLHTGDIVVMHEDGMVQYVDRLKELIIVQGFNVYPTEVEDILYKHLGIMETAVIGIPDEKKGEAVLAVVKLKPGSTTTADEFLAYCKENLAPYKIPQAIRFVDDFPRTAAGKILKKELKKQFAQK